jgi:hypothetical protein
MNTKAAEATTRDLDDYMKFRAEREDQDYDLYPQFFGQLLETGVRIFFGVMVGDDGRLLEDTQQPELFKQWQDQKNDY